jgi:hypothetical protein
MKSLERRILRLEQVARTHELPQLEAWRRPGGSSGGRWPRFHMVPPLRVRFGNVRSLPGDYHGERHVIVAKQLPERNGQEWVEFEEVAGPAPSPPPADSGLPNCLHVMFVGAPGDQEEPPPTGESCMSGQQG